MLTKKSYRPFGRVKKILILHLVSLIFAGQTNSSPVSIPIVLELSNMEREQYKWNPEYQQNVVTFDSGNRPYIRSRDEGVHNTEYIHTLRNGEWIKIDLLRSIKSAHPDFSGFNQSGGGLSARVVFDKDDHMYTVVRVVTQGVSGSKIMNNLLLYSTDFGEEWQVYNLGSQDSFVIEFNTNSSLMDSTPLIGLWTKTGEHPGAWASIHKFEVTYPIKVDGQLQMSPKVTLTENGLGAAIHAGGASFSVTKDNKSYVVWESVNDDDESFGTPGFLSVFNRSTNKIESKTLLGGTFKVNDVHNTSGICIDSNDYLHIILGAHNRNFKYIKSESPMNGTQLTSPQDTVDVYNTAFNGQTYVSLICGNKNNLHLVFRSHKENLGQYFLKSSSGYYKELSYQKKTSAGWTKVKPIVIPPLPNYSNYYQQLSIDRLGNLVLSYSWFGKDFRPINPYARSTTKQMSYHLFRTLLLADEHGNNWSLPEKDDFIKNTTWNIKDILVGDFDGNNEDDFIYLARKKSDLKVNLVHSNSGNWNHREERFSDGIGINSLPVLVGDINGDGKDDLIMLYHKAGQLVIRSRFFPDYKVVDQLQLDGEGVDILPEHSHAGDINGDGKSDLVFPYIFNGNLALRSKLSAGDGTWTAKTFVTNLTPEVLVDSHLMDANGDGKDDLVFKYRVNGKLTMTTLFAVNSDLWSIKTNYYPDGMGIDFMQGYSGHFNSDNKKDLLYFYKKMVGDRVRIFTRIKYSQGDGDWITKDNILTDGLGILTYKPQVGDFDGDGKSDILITVRIGNNVFLRVKSSLGDGTWDGSPDYNLPRLSELF
jgi:hypothetical protein